MQWIDDLQLQVSTPILAFLQQYWLFVAVLGFCMVLGLLYPDRRTSAASAEGGDFDSNSGDGDGGGD